MLGLPLLVPAVLEVIPRAAINGVLVFRGGNGLISKCGFKRSETHPNGIHWNGPI